MFKQMFLILLLCITCYTQTVRIPKIEFSPKEYVCYNSGIPISIDGKLDELQWAKTEWTDNFIDIRGTSKPAPRFSTRVKMLWDEKFFYIAAQIEEPDIWGTLTTRDDTIFHDNCFEVFIDPDGDTQNYCELEINALNTIWDLLLVKTYRDMQQPGISGWDIKGLKTNIAINGSVNKPGDKDSFWIVEIAFPWKIFKELTSISLPPKNKDQWRINFLRVEWETKIKEFHYIKQVDSLTKKPLADFWSWSPQGIVNMHYPEMWGYVQFSSDTAGSKKVEFVKHKEENVKWFLRQIYYKEKLIFDEHKKFTNDLNELNINNKLIAGYKMPPVIECTTETFEAFLQSEDDSEKIYINNDGLIRVVKSGCKYFSK